MKWNVKKLLLLLLLLALTVVLVLFISSGSEEKETPAISMPENLDTEVFNKTIHDFGDLRVENLDEQENANFIVYSESVHEITMTPGSNVLVNTDYEKLSYTFTNADDTLKAMKKGDVFFAPASDLAPNGITVKVKNIKVSGDNVTVYSQQVGLADFFEYVDISMDVPLTLAEDQGAASVPVTARRYVVLLSANPKSNSVNLPLKYPFEIGAGATTIKGSLGASMVVHVDWNFDAKTMQLYCDVYSDTDFDHVFNFSYGGELLKKEFEGKTMPARLGAFCTLALESKLTVEVSGEVKGTLHYTAADRYGFTAYASPKGAAFNSYQQNLKPGVGEGSLGNMEADVDVGLELKPVLGFGFIGNVFASVNGGVNIHGETEPIVETPTQSEAESVHACDFCIDGDVNTSASISCGMELTFVSKLMDLFLDEETKSELEELGGGILCPEKELYSGDWKVGDFYISKRGDKTDCGWTECPHYLYRTIVTVTTEDGSNAAGAEITVVTAENTVETAVANYNGEASLYLPVGETSLNASVGDYSGSAELVVERPSADTSVELNKVSIDMKEKVSFKYHIVLCDLEYWGQGDLSKDTFPELEDMIIDKYGIAVTESRDGSHSSHDSFQLRVEAIMDSHAEVGRNNFATEPFFHLRVYIVDYFNSEGEYDADHALKFSYEGQLFTWPTYESSSGDYQVYQADPSYVYETVSAWQEGTHWTWPSEPDYEYRNKSVGKHYATVLQAFQDEEYYKSVLLEHLEKAFNFVDLYISGDWDVEHLSNITG